MNANDGLFGESDHESIGMIPDSSVQVKSDVILSDSDNEDVFEEKMKEQGSTKASNANKDEIRDLLGGSDDEFGDEKNEAEIKVAKAADLDQILGKFGSSTGEKMKEVTSSTLSIPEQFRMPPNSVAFFVRTPNFLGIQPLEYDNSTYDKDADGDIFGEAGDIVRWRYRRDSNGNVLVNNQGVPIRDSNARIVKYDDGSMELIIGNTVFNSKTVAAANCFIYEQQKSVETVTKMEVDGEGVEEHKENVVETACLECTSELPSRLILLPTSLHSETHTRMSLKISEKFKKESKISIRDYEKIHENPEKTLHELAKKEEELMRKEKKAKQQAQDRMGVVAGSYGSRYGRPSMTAEYIDHEEGDNLNLAQLKKSFKERKPLPKRDENRSRGRQDDDEEDEEDDEEADEDNDFITNEDDEDEDEGESLGSQDTEEGSDEEEEEEIDSDGADDEEEPGEVEGESDGEKPKKQKKERKEKKRDKKDKKEHRDKKKNKKDKGKNKEKRSEEPKKRKQPENNEASAKEQPLADDEPTALQQRKKFKRNVIDSDDEM